MRANLALGLAQGIFLPHPRPNRAWLAELGTTIEDADPVLAANAMSASAMWAANAATVSPAPDTADGKCHLTVANLRTMPHRSHEWPATLAQLRLAFAERRAFAVHAPVPAGVRRRGRGQPHAAGARRTASRASRCSSTASPAAPSRRASISKRRSAIARLHRLDPDRVAVRRAVRGSDRGRRLPQRRGRGRQRARAVRARAGVRRQGAAAAALRAPACPGFEYVEVPAARSAARRRDPLLSVQRPAGDSADRRERR